MLCGIFIFWSLLLLIDVEKGVEILRNDFFKLIKEKDNGLPVDFCLDMLE